MADLKSLKSIDLSSITIMGTSLNFIWSIILTILIMAPLLISVGFEVGFIFMGIGIIFGTIIFSISEYFGISFLYNCLITKMKDIKLDILDMNRITKISVLSTSLMVAVISLIVSIFTFPLVLSSSLLQFFLQTMMFQGFEEFAFFIGNLVFSPSFIPMFILYAFVAGFLLTVVGTFVFNKISPKIGGLKISFSQEGNLTKINSINPKSMGIIAGIIGLVFGLINELIIIVHGLIGSLPAELTTISILQGILVVAVVFLIGGFIYGALSSVLYNFFSKKLGPVKLELKNSE